MEEVFTNMSAIGVRQPSEIEREIRLVCWPNSRFSGHWSGHRPIQRSCTDTRHLCKSSIRTTSLGPLLLNFPVRILSSPSLLRRLSMNRAHHWCCT